MDVLTIEDEDGFTTSWPWPEGQTALGNPGFVEACEMQHDRLRAQGELFKNEEGLTGGDDHRHHRS